MVDVMMKERWVGGVIVNEMVGGEVGQLNRIIWKTCLGDMISDVMKGVGVGGGCELLDGIKKLGQYMGLKGGV